MTPILHYDPPGRLIRTEQPNGTQAHVVFDAWKQETWDENDDVEGTRWLADRLSLPAGDPERRAAELAREHAGTPAIAHLDPLGRTFLTVADNGTLGKNPTRVELDIEGNPRVVTDARAIVTQRQSYDVLGRPIFQASADGGERRVLPDAAGKPLRSWDARDQRLRHAYDGLQRPTHLFVSEGTGPELLRQRAVYGEGHAEAVARNLRERLHQTYDGAGVTTTSRYDFKGNPREGARRLALAIHDTPDWSTLAGLTTPAEIEDAAASLLEDESFPSTLQFDALNRPVSRTTADDSEALPAYNEANLLERLEVRIRGAATATAFVSNLDYNARGQRESVERGNGTTTTYEYDDRTFRLTRLRSLRAADGAVVQDLRYTYDPVGNVTEVRDGADTTLLFGQTPVSGDGRYRYDALYWLIEATGREHPGQQPTHEDPTKAALPHPNDTTALRRYTEQYFHDAVGNLDRVVHQAGADGWTRRYRYAADSNRLQSTSRPGDPDAGPFSDTYEHDPHGNMTRMPHLSPMAWDWRDRLASVDRGGGGQVFFTYDAAGERVRKVWEHGAIVEERIYLGGYELYRRRSPTLDLERQTLHVMDDRHRVALVETKTVDTSAPPGSPVSRLRHQLDNLVGSSLLELDGAGLIITYEEYFPYGATSFHAARSGVEVSAKRYRYTGKEKDEETGLCYHGARYYAPWLGRWTAADPGGLADGINRYAYCRNNPTTRVDPTGRDSRDNKLQLGPFEFSNISLDLKGARLQFNLSLKNLLGKGPVAVGINTARLEGTASLSSDVAIPSLGVKGFGGFKLQISPIEIEEGHFRAALTGKLTMNVSPFRLNVDLSAAGRTVVDNPIYPGDLQEHLRHSVEAGRGEFSVSGRLSTVHGSDIGHFRLEGSTIDNASGPLSFRAHVRPDFAPYIDATMSGRGHFAPGVFELGGKFSGRAPLALTWGRWDYSLHGGFRATGHYLGIPIPGLTSLTPSFDPTTGVPADPEARRSRGGEIPVLSPGTGLGYTYFDLAPNRRLSLSIGLAPTSEYVPYFESGAYQPFKGPPAGSYAGAIVRGSF